MKIKIRTSKVKFSMPGPFGHDGEGDKSHT